MKQLIKLVVTTLLCAGAALTHAKAHNYDLPYICESGTNLTSLESTQKLTFETTVIPIAKQVMKEAGALAGSLGIGYAGRIILVCAIGYADWNSAELLAVAITPTQLQPNMLARALSLSKILTVAQVWKLCNSGQLDCTANAMVLSGIVPWNKTVQPWHSQCKISDLIQIPVTSCDIPRTVSSPERRRYSFKALPIGLSM